MHSPGTRNRTTGPYNISDVAPRLGATKLAATATIIRAALTLAVITLLLLITARPAQAQTETVLGSKAPGPTETVLYSFTGGSDGAGPQGLLTSDGSGNFYGMTSMGGLGYGTVFELSPDGSGGWKETTLYTFTGGADGADPSYSNVIFDSLGNLYGATPLGGATGYGVVFELSPAGAGWTETVLYNFCSEYRCPDGADPMNLIMDAAGNLYGTTWQATYGTGTVFELSPSGNGWTEKVIYLADNHICAGLTMDAAGNIFGVTYSTVFELSPNGKGGWDPTNIHSFTRPKDGNLAYGTPVLDQAGNLYGTTQLGGAKGYGIVYKLSPQPNGKWKEKIIHSFKGGPKDGMGPVGGIVFDAAGNIYGTTPGGGKYNARGTVFELMPPFGTRKYYTEKVLWNFSGTDGASPSGGLTLDSTGNLYGAAAFGGSDGYGVVFAVTP